LERAVTVRGRVADFRHIEHGGEPVEGLAGPVEISVRRIVETPAAEEGMLAFLARILAGMRTRAEIDRSIEEERASWERPDGWAGRRDR
jgi:hypothetical protein